MVAMRRADAMPQDGYVTYPQDPACQRRRAQYAVLLDAWDLLFPGDRIMQNDMSKWLCFVARIEGEGTEGEAVLDAAFAFHGAPHPTGISFPKQAFWTALHNSLSVLPLPKSERTWRGRRS
jgi:hypothetical protein